MLVRNGRYLKFKLKYNERDKEDGERQKAKNRGTVIKQDRKRGKEIKRE
jgi:hypothetical protein